MGCPKPSESTIIIVDDESSIRDALEILIVAAGYQCLSYASGEDFLAAPLPPTPRCLLLDLQLGGKSGLDVQDELNAPHGTLPILFVSGDDNTARAVRAMKAGAIDFVQKPFDPDELLERIEKALQISLDGHDEFVSAHHDAALLAHLTQREEQVLALLVDGNLNKEVAQILNISTRTAECHRMHIMEKLEARTLADLTRVWLHNERAADLSEQ